MEQPIKLDYFSGDISDEPGEAIECVSFKELIDWLYGETYTWQIR